MKNHDRIRKNQALQLFVCLLLLSATSVSFAQTSQSPTQTVCPGTEPYLVTATPGSVYSWSVTPGTSGTEWQVNGTGNSISVEWRVAGVYTLTVTERNSQGCTGLPVSLLVTVNQSPGATITGTAAVCQNAVQPLITFTGSNGTAPYTFTYNINGGPDHTVTTVSGNSVTVAAPTGTTGIFAYNLTRVSDAGGSACSQVQTGTATITVNNMIVPTVTAAADPVCFGTTGSVYTTEPGMINYTWAVNGGLITAGGTRTDNSVTVTWNGTGPYSVSVTYTNAGGCVSTTPTVVNVNVIPLPVTSPIFHN